MKLQNKKIAFGLTSVFYTFENTIKEMKQIVAEGAKIIPIMPIDTYQTNSKYGKAKDFIQKIEKIADHQMILAGEEVEKIDTDIMVIAPCSRKCYCKTFFCHIRFICFSRSKNTFWKKQTSSTSELLLRMVSVLMLKILGNY